MWSLCPIKLRKYVFNVQELPGKDSLHGRPTALSLTQHLIADVDEVDRSAVIQCSTTHKKEKYLNCQSLIVIYQY